MNKKYTSYGTGHSTPLIHFTHIYLNKTILVLGLHLTNILHQAYSRPVWFIAIKKLTTKEKEVKKKPHKTKLNTF